MIEAEVKTQLIQQYRTHEKDSGSPEVQVAILTNRINAITEHLKGHRKDHNSRRGLLMLVNRRATLLRYLKRKSFERYAAVIKSLNLRK